MATRDTFVTVADGDQLNEGYFNGILQKMIDAGEKIKPSFFNGKYINITFPEDIKKAKKLLFNQD